MSGTDHEADHTDSENGHPMDQYYLQNDKQQQKDKVAGDEQNGQEATSLSYNPESDAGSQSDEDDADDANAEAAAAKGGVQPTPAPVGVVIVDDAEEMLQSKTMERLLRMPRYFDDNVEAASFAKQVRCYRCGQAGHVARSCTSATWKPCSLCAETDHEAATCPNRLCYRCGRKGHMSKDCRNMGIAPVCFRCGRDECNCTRRGDYVRFEGGCCEVYRSSDLAKVSCSVCNALGHLICKEETKDLGQPSCYNCGAAGHWGEDCPEPLPPHLRAERADDSRNQQQHRYADSAPPASYGGRGFEGLGSYQQAGSQTQWQNRAPLHVQEMQARMQQQAMMHERMAQQQMAQQMMQRQRSGDFYGGGGGSGGYGPGSGGYGGGSGGGARWGSGQRDGGRGYQQSPGGRWGGGEDGRRGQLFSGMPGFKRRGDGGDELQREFGRQSKMQRR